MSLIGRLIGSLLKRGQITIVIARRQGPDLWPGRRQGADRSHHGPQSAVRVDAQPAAGGRRNLYGRPADHRGWDDPRPSRADHRRNNRWEEGGNSRKAIKKGKLRWKRLFGRNRAASSKRNVAHHYDLKDELYELFLDDDRQYSCAYFTDPTNSLEQAQADKKAHIAAKLHLKPGQRVLDIGCGWGGTALYLHKVAGVDVTRHHPVGRAVEGRAAGGPRKPASPTMSGSS